MSGTDKTPVPQRGTDPGVDYYVQRLARASASLEVRARDDILDTFGITLVRQGQAIDVSVADRVMNFQLLLGQRLPRPISDQVHFKKILDGKQLFHHTYTLFGKYPDILAIHKKLSSDAELSSWTVTAQLPEAIWQQLTLLEQQLPDRFGVELFCGWFSALIASRLKFDSEGVRHAYLAGLLHDIGFLNVPGDVLEKSGKLTAEEWRSIQGHVDFSRYCLENTPDIPEQVISAVAEHHERYDGSGYPQRIMGAELSRLGLIVGLADSLNAVRCNQFSNVGRNLYDAIPYLQMNAALHGIEVSNAAVTLLRDSGLQTTRLNPCATVAEFAFRLMGRARMLLQQIGYLDQILDALSILPLDAQGIILIKGASQVQAMIVSSGLTRGELITWLESMQGEDDASILAELNELELMLNELRWHVQRLTRSIDVFFDANTREINAPADQTIDAAVTSLRNSAASQ